MKWKWLILCFTLAFNSGFAQTPCTLKKSDHNIKVYSCKTEGSPYNAIKAEFEVNATLDRYVNLVRDVENYPAWRYRESNSKVLKAISHNEIIYYTNIHAPFPVSDRDLIVKLTIHHDSIQHKLTATIEGMANYLPHEQDFVRVPSMKSTMVFTAVSPSKLKVQYDALVDPGGSIPAWVANMFSTQGPYETFRNMISRMERKP